MAYQRASGVESLEQRRKKISRLLFLGSDEDAVLLSAALDSYVVDCGGRQGFSNDVDRIRRFQKALCSIGRLSYSQTVVSVDPDGSLHRRSAAADFMRSASPRLPSSRLGKP
jgi:hypothetical protein